MGHIPGIEEILLLHDQACRIDLEPVDDTQRAGGCADVAEELNGDGRLLSIHERVGYFDARDEPRDAGRYLIAPRSQGQARFFQRLMFGGAAPLGRLASARAVDRELKYCATDSTWETACKEAGATPHELESAFRAAFGRP